MKNVVFLLLALLPLSMSATSTSGTSRLLAIDGIVSAGAPSGSNAAQWELDELLQGVNAIINWYATWDDDSLYIGKTGGSNADRAVVYLRAEYHRRTIQLIPASISAG